MKKYSVRLKIIMSLILFFNVAFNASATVQALVKKEMETEAPQNQVTRELPQFSQHEENYLLFDYFRGEETEGNIDVQLSFRYLLTDLEIPMPGATDWAVAMFYTGEFDFFAGTRKSGPVITTRHNIGLYWAMLWNPKNDGISELRVSAEHESNGQVVRDNIGLMSSERDFRREYHLEPEVSEFEIRQMAMQTISRANNFVSIGGKYKWNYEDNSCGNILKCVDIHVKLRAQLKSGLEDDIWWDETKTDIRLRDYVGTEVIFDTTFRPGDIKQGLSFTYRTGQIIGGRVGRNNTFDIKYYADIPIPNLFSPSKKIEIPLVLTYHYGYLEELYKYSEKSAFWGIGIHARY